MRTLYCWLVFLGVFIRYLFWRAGVLRRRPEFTDHPEEIPTAVTQMFGWKRRVHVVNGELCPDTPPALFVANHHKLDDPIDLWPGIYWGSKGGIIPSFVMRDDFFRGFPWTWLPFNMNHLCEMTGAVLISRDHLQLGQMRQLLGKLGKSESLVLFPGRTRSRTGAWFEYRDDITEPGSAGFIIGNAQRRHPGLRIPAVPVARTWHPVRNTSAVVFGGAMYLAADADRAAQRALDCALLVRVGELVEVHAVHLVAVLVWLHALHRGNAPLPVKEIETAVADWTKSDGHPCIDARLRAAVGAECRAALRYFAASGLLREENSVILPRAERILACPPWNEHYRKTNPAKYWSNQVLHLPGVIQWAEHTVLEGG